MKIFQEFNTISKTIEPIVKFLVWEQYIYIKQKNIYILLK